MRLHKISKYFNFRLKDLRYGDVKEITIEIESDAKVIGFKGSENEFELTYCSSTEDTFERKIFIMDEHSTEELSDVSFIGKITCENCCGSETDFYFFLREEKEEIEVSVNLNTIDESLTIDIDISGKTFCGHANDSILLNNLRSE